MRVIYRNPEAQLKNHGHLSETFNIQRGIRQGCPISALLFILCTEILAIKIRSCEEIKGYKINQGLKDIKIAQYADDTILFLNDENEV